MARDKAVRAFATEIDLTLKSVGFIRADLSWHRASDLGDYAVVGIQLSDRVPDGKRVFINSGVVPGPWWEWMKFLYPRSVKAAGTPTTADALLSQRVDPDPPTFWRGWILTEANAKEEGIKAARELLYGVVPRLIRLLDRDEAIAELNEREGNRFVLPTLLAERGRSPELDHLLTDLKSDDDADQRFVAWARAFADSH